MMRICRSDVVVMIALIIWSVISFALVFVFTVHLCGGALLQTVGDDPLASPPPPLTQAEMDARIAACAQPRPGELVVPALGYLLILGAWAASAPDEPEVSSDP
jgi:hypothetical protein